MFSFSYYFATEDFSLPQWPTKFSRRYERIVANDRSKKIVDVSNKPPHGVKGVGWPPPRMQGEWQRVQGGHCTNAHGDRQVRGVDAAIPLPPFMLDHCDAHTCFAFMWIEIGRCVRVPRRVL